MPSNIEIKAKLSKGMAFAEDLAMIMAKNQEVFENLNQIDTFFNVPGGKRMKLRVEDERASLISYQRNDIAGPKLSDYKLTLIPLDSTESLKETLAMSLGIKGEVKKHRKVYIIEWDKYPLTARVHLDHVNHLGDFIEFEVIMDKLSDIGLGEEMAAELMSKFEIKNEDLIVDAYVDILLKE